MRAAALFLALAVVLTGCLGAGDGDAGDEPIQRQRADVTAELGGIQGVVTDTAVQPVVGANVTLLEIDRTVRSAADGSYAFSRVQPGTYTLSVRQDGFVSATEAITVAGGKVAIADFILAHLASEDAYTQALEMVGFFECGVEVGWNITALPEPADFFFLGLAVCAVPNGQLPGSGNVTNDRFAHFFELEAPLDTLIYEMSWDPSTQFSEWMTTQLEVQGFSNANPGRFWRVQEPSPIHARLDKEVFVQLDEDFRAACEEGEDAYCGFSFWDAGWPLQTRVFPAWQCASETAGGCLALQQEFTHIITAFYNAPAPEGYSALTGT